MSDPIHCALAALVVFIKESFGNSGFETPSIKVQRKGSPQTCYVPIAMVETYEVLVLSELTPKSTC